MERDRIWLSRQLRNMNFLSSCSDKEFEELTLAMEKRRIPRGRPSSIREKEVS